jgi:hypothetical protein
VKLFELDGHNNERVRKYKHYNQETSVGNREVIDGALIWVYVARDQKLSASAPNVFFYQRESTTRLRLPRLRYIFGLVGALKVFL